MSAGSLRKGDEIYGESGHQNDVSKVDELSENDYSHEDSESDDGHDAFVAIPRLLDIDTLITSLTEVMQYFKELREIVVLGPERVCPCCLTIEGSSTDHKNTETPEMEDMSQEEAGHTFRKKLRSISLITKNMLPLLTPEEEDLIISDTDIASPSNTKTVKDANADKSFSDIECIRHSGASSIASDIEVIHSLEDYLPRVDFVKKGNLYLSSKHSQTSDEKPTTGVKVTEKPNLDETLPNVDFMDNFKSSAVSPDFDIIGSFQNAFENTLSARKCNSSSRIKSEITDKDQVSNVNVGSTSEDSFAADETNPPASGENSEQGNLTRNEPLSFSFNGNCPRITIKSPRKLFPDHGESKFDQSESKDRTNSERLLFRSSDSYKKNAIPPTDLGSNPYRIAIERGYAIYGGDEKVKSSAIFPQREEKSSSVFSRNPDADSCLSTEKAQNIFPEKNKPEERENFNKRGYFGSQLENSGTKSSDISHPKPAVNQNSSLTVRVSKELPNLENQVSEEKHNVAGLRCNKIALGDTLKSVTDKESIIDKDPLNIHGDGSSRNSQNGKNFEKKLLSNAPETNNKIINSECKEPINGLFENSTQIQRKGDFKTSVRDGEAKKTANTNQHEREDKVPTGETKDNMLSIGKYIPEKCDREKGIFRNSDSGEPNDKSLDYLKQIPFKNDFKDTVEDRRVHLDEFKKMLVNDQHKIPQNAMRDFMVHVPKCMRKAKQPEFKEGFRGTRQNWRSEGERLYYSSFRPFTTNYQSVHPQSGVKNISGAHWEDSPQSRSDRNSEFHNRQSYSGFQHNNTVHGIAKGPQLLAKPGVSKITQDTMLRPQAGSENIQYVPAAKSFDPNRVYGQLNNTSAQPMSSSYVSPYPPAQNTGSYAVGSNYQAPFSYSYNYGASNAYQDPFQSIDPNSLPLFPFVSPYSLYNLYLQSGTPVWNSALQHPPANHNPSVGGYSQATQAPTSTSFAPYSGLNFFM